VSKSLRLVVPNVLAAALPLLLLLIASATTTAQTLPFKPLAGTGGGTASIAMAMLSIGPNGSPQITTISDSDLKNRKKTDNDREN